MREIEAVVSGRVQGVFFRNFTSRTAHEHGVTGFVENQSDGTVHVVAQGAEESLQELINALKRGPTFARVDDVSIAWREPTRQYNDFTIER